MQIVGPPQYPQQLVPAPPAGSELQPIGGESDLVEGPSKPPAPSPLPVEPIADGDDGAEGRPVLGRLDKLIKRLEKLLSRLERTDRPGRADSDAEKAELPVTRQIAKQLGKINRTVSAGLKAVGKELVQDEKGLDRAEAQRVRQAVKEAGKVFGRELRQGLRQADAAEPFDGDQLVASVREAFDRLVGNLSSLLEAVGSDERPATVASFDGVRLIEFEFKTSIEASLGVVPPAIEPDAVAPPADPPIEAEQASAPTLDLGGLIQQLGERFESLIAELNELLAGLGSTEEPAPSPGPAPGSGEIQPEIAVEIYANVTVSFSETITGSELDAVS